MNIHGVLHISVLVSDLGRALEFYEGVLGLRRSDARPEMDFAGAWLGVGAQDIHLLVLPNPDPVEGRPEHGGRDRHVALAVASLEPVRAALDAAAVRYTLSRSGRRALFCRDPDGNALELVESAPPEPGR